MYIETHQVVSWMHSIIFLKYTTIEKHIIQYIRVTPRQGQESNNIYRAHTPYA